MHQRSPGAPSLTPAIASPNRKNFDFGIEKTCFPENHILILESSQGGNSHQSETNLIERPLKQQPSLAPARVPSRSFRLDS